MGLGHRLAGNGQLVDGVVQRLLALGQIGGQGGPIVHLRVDVAGVLAVPGRSERLVPDALQIGGLPALAAGCDEQVAAVLEDERGQVRIVAVMEIAEAEVGGLGCCGVEIADVERYAVEESLVVKTCDRTSVTRFL